MAWLEQFKVCFGHRAQPLALRRYVQGLLSDSARHLSGLPDSDRPGVGGPRPSTDPAAATANANAAKRNDEST